MRSCPKSARMIVPVRKSCVCDIRFIAEMPNAPYGDGQDSSTIQSMTVEATTIY